MLDDEGG